MAMATALGDARHMDAAFELPAELETQLHESLLRDARRGQRAQFRPGVNRKTGAALDVVAGDRSKKKIARAITVLSDDYGVPAELIREALAYANSWEDALSFLALQRPSEELPEKLRSKPGGRIGDKVSEDEESGSLQVVSTTNAPSNASLDGDGEPQVQAGLQFTPVTVENWDDDEDDPATSAPANLPSSEEANELQSNVSKQEAEEAMSWTQKYLLQLEAEEEREKERRKQEAAMTPEERQLRDLEMQYTALNDRMAEMKAGGKLTKKKQKVMAQDVQHVRSQLVRLGWDEADYRRRQRELRGESDSIPPKHKAKDEVKHEDASVVEVPKQSAGGSRLGFSGGGDADSVVDSAVRSSSANKIVVDEPNDGDFGGGLFDQPTIPSLPTVQTTIAEKDKVGQVDGATKTGGDVLASYPATLGSWTGKTPRDLLQDYCQKQKMARPQYKKLSTRGSHLYSISIDKKGAPRQEFAAPDDLFTSKSGFRTIDEAKDAVATVALYALTPNLPLYGMMPPPFRALWLEWERAKQQAASASIDAVKQAFDSLVDEIFDEIPDEIAKMEPVQVELKEDIGANLKHSEDGKTAVTEQPTLESWDVDDWDADLSDTEDGTTASVAEESKSRDTALVNSRQQDDVGDPTISKALKDAFLRKVNSEQHQRLLPKRKDLPIASFKHKIIETLDAYDVILISGETGCGKSTQVPQYLLEEMVAARSQGATCQIVCTQPRRLAATSLAERVSHELGEKAMAQGDSLCGFQIRLENRMTKNTRLMFCTTGILLRRLQEPSTLENELSHVIVDEVHERDVQNDVLLSMLRTFLETKNKLRRRPLKVILMSATLNAASFQHYFGGEAKCPMLSVPGRTFPVEEFYLEDAIELTQFVVDEMSPSYRRPEDSGSLQSTKITVSGRGGTSHTQRVTWREATSSRGGNRRGGADDDGSSEYSDRTLLTLDHLEESVINYELIEQLLERLVTESDLLRMDGSGSRTSASVLVFMPGLQEISNLLDMLSGNRHLRDTSKYELLPLHSSLSPEDQRRIFDMRRGIIRIIATTNIAETSLTIEDVKVVIDSGRAKEMRHDSTTKTNLLEEIWISRANAKQRLGRAGRTSGGVCYRLYSRATFKHAMPEQPLPEIMRAPLTSLCLQIKTFGVESMCAQFLEACLDPPDASSVSDALRELYEIGALEIDPNDLTREQLTTLGSHLAQLPVDAKVGKLLILGAIFGEFDVASTCAAILETKSPFVAPYGYQKEMQAARQLFSVVHSDLLTDANAFNAWRERFADGSRTGRRQEEKAFCRQYFLSYRSLLEIVKLKKQFSGIVAQLGFLQGLAPHKPLTTASCALVSALLFAGLEPNVMYVDPALSPSHRAVLREENDRGTTRAYVHPGSINAKISNYTSPFLTYAVKLHTSQVYLPTCSMVLPTALCVFSFAMEVVYPHRATASGDVTIKLNEWITLKSSPRSALVLQEVRRVTRAFVDEQIESPPFRPGRGGVKHSSTHHQDLLGSLVTLFRQEYEVRDPKQVLMKQLNPPLK